ncbi:MAG: cell division protein ZapA [Bacteroidota bacterium]|nr:cell division protein ZapA [Bacteroidota bacterium]
MSEKIKIKLTIADRVYPLTIFPEQEASLRSSALKIQEMIKKLEQDYAVRDKQDVLAMCSLQYAAQLEQTLQSKASKEGSSNKVQELIELIDLHLSNY